MPASAGQPGCRVWLYPSVEAEARGWAAAVLGRSAGCPWRVSDAGLRTKKFVAGCWRGSRCARCAWAVARPKLRGGLIEPLPPVTGICR